MVNGLPRPHYVRPRNDNQCIISSIHRHIEGLVPEISVIIIITQILRHKVAQNDSYTLCSLVPQNDSPNYFW